MGSVTFPNFPNFPETGPPGFPELPAPPIRGQEERDGKSDGIHQPLQLTLEH